MVSPAVIDTAIDRLGEDVVLSEKSKSYSTWGDESYTTSNSTIVVVHNDIIGDEGFNREGRYKPGDKVFFAKSAVTGADVGNSIIFNGQEFEIKDTVRHHIQNQDFVREIRCGKI